MLWIWRVVDSTLAPLTCDFFHVTAPSPLTSPCSCRVPVSRLRPRDRGRTPGGVTRVEPDSTLTNASEGNTGTTTLHPERRMRDCSGKRVPVKVNGVPTRMSDPAPRGFTDSV